MPLRISKSITLSERTMLCLICDWVMQASPGPSTVTAGVRAASRAARAAAASGEGAQAPSTSAAVKGKGASARASCVRGVMASLSTERMRR